MGATQDKFPELCNSTVVGLRFFKFLDEELERVRSVENAHAHGESPVFGEVLDELKGRKQIGIEEIIGGLPLWKLLLTAQLDFLADNNRRLLEAVADLISG